MAWKTTSRVLTGAGTETFSLSGDSEWFCYETTIATVIQSSLDNITYGAILDREGANKSVVSVVTADPRLLPQYPYIKFTIGGAGTITVSERVNDPS